MIGPFRALIRPLKGTLRQRARHRQDFSAAYLASALEASLKRLRSDYIDLYQLHGPPRDVLERGEAFEALERWKGQGKIRFYGVSARTLDDALFCLRNTSVAALQVSFNLLEREAAEQLLPEARAGGVAIIARVPFGRGLLTDAGRVTTGLRTDDPRITARAAVERKRLCFLIEGQRRSWTEAALRFVLDHEGVSTVIPGTKSPAHLEQNLAAGQATPLSRDEMRRIWADGSTSTAGLLERA